MQLLNLHYELSCDTEKQPLNCDTSKNCLVAVLRLIYGHFCINLTEVLLLKYLNLVWSTVGDTVRYNTIRESDIDMAVLIWY